MKKAGDGFNFEITTYSANERILLFSISLSCNKARQRHVLSWKRPFSSHCVKRGQSITQNNSNRKAKCTRKQLQCLQPVCVAVFMSYHSKTTND